MTKSIKIITGFLGISMFMFGVLKFINPFKHWYTQQILLSELPFKTIPYWSGQLGEIIVGIGFIILLTNRKITPSKFNSIFYSGNILVIVMMLVAFYVHLHPNVPADILPLKISLPFIPGFFLCLAIFNLYLKKKNIEKK